MEQAYGYAFILAAHAAARTAGVQNSVFGACGNCTVAIGECRVNSQFRLGNWISPSRAYAKKGHLQVQDNMIACVYICLRKVCRQFVERSRVCWLHVLTVFCLCDVFKVAKDNTDVARVFDMLERKFWLPDKTFSCNEP